MIKYKINDKIKALLQVTNIDEGDELPYYVTMLGSPDQRGFWMSEKDMEEVNTQGDPELRKTFLKQQIESMQKELEEMQ